MSVPRPPGPARWAIKLLLSRATAELVLGDLEEDYRRIVEEAGEDAARAWYRMRAWREIRSRMLERRTWTMDAWTRDLGYALRSLGRAPGFAAATVLTLALGMGGATAVAVVVETQLVGPLPVPEPHRLVDIREVHDGRTRSVAPANYLDWRARTRTFDELAAHRVLSASLTVEGVAQHDLVAEVSGNFFAALGVEATLGRSFDPTPNAAFADRVAVLTHRLWRDRFASDPAVTGRTLQVDELTYTVVGVMAPGVAFPDPSVSLWMRSPREAPDIRSFSGDLTTLRDAWYFDVVGRLGPGVALPAARQEMSSIAAALAVEHPTSNADSDVQLMPLVEVVTAGLRPTVLLMTIAVALVLLAACANAAHLTLARSTTRLEVVALRRVLGATRGALVRHHLAEGWTLGLSGAATGLGLAAFVLRGVGALLSTSVPRPGDLAVGGTAALVAAVMGLVLGGALGLLAYVRTGSPRALGASSILRFRGAGRVSHGLVAAQVAASVALLASAGLVGRSIREVSRVELGIDTDGLLTFYVAFPDARLRPYEERVQVYRDLLARVASVPGVTAVGFASGSPLAMGAEAGLNLVERPDDSDPPSVGWQPVSSGFFDALGIPVQRGRALEPSDDAGTLEVAVVNQALVTEIFGDQDPLGREVTIGLDGHDKPLTIVGVVGDARTRGPTLPPGPVLYRPIAQAGGFYAADRAFFAVRAGAGSGSVTETVRSAVPGLPVYQVRDVEQLAAAFTASRSAVLVVLAVFAGTALLLGAVGVYGVAAYGVRSQRREIGVRLALGADGRRLLREIVARGLARAALGIPAGILITLALGRSLSSLLFGVQHTDPATYLAVSGLVLAVTIVALLLPARSAARTEASEALRGGPPDAGSV